MQMGRTPRSSLFAVVTTGLHGMPARALTGSTGERGTGVRVSTYRRFGQATGTRLRRLRPRQVGAMVAFSTTRERWEKTNAA